MEASAEATHDRTVKKLVSQANYLKRRCELLDRSYHECLDSLSEVAGQAGLLAQASSADGHRLQKAIDKVLDLAEQRTEQQRNRIRHLKVLISVCKNCKPAW